MFSTNINDLRISLIVAFFITVLTYVAHFILISVNRDNYSFISVIYHNIDSFKHLAKEIFIGVNILVDFLFYLIVLMTGFKIIKVNNSLLKYLILSFVGIIIIVLLFVNSINITALRGDDSTLYENISNYHFIMYYLSITLLLLFIPLAFKNENKIIIMENVQTKLNHENIATKYLALKNKLEPHFLFNSFSVLDALIDDDKVIAHKYLRDLTSIYRYILQDPEEVTLREALAEIENYISILKFRHGDGVLFNQMIDSKYLDYKVIPMAIQIIVENTIKHNIHSIKLPLVVSIQTNKDAILTICNNIQPPETSTLGNGVGLTSLSKLYIAKWGKDIKITRNNSQFCVAVPLISRLYKTENQLTNRYNH